MNAAVKGTIFDIKHYAVHDGPGIRTTVFFKGCPLNCLWCHNPEGIEGGPELVVRASRCAADCTACLAACPEGALFKSSGRIEVHRGKCSLCGKCEEACFYEALEIAGKEVAVAEVLEEVEKDNVFYDESGGGVTFSGGEPLSQPLFLEALVDELKSRGVRTALDTSGFASREALEKVAAKVDLILFDLKLINEVKHKKYTGVSNRVILDNLRALSQFNTEICIRIPLIAGVNDDADNISGTSDFVRSLKNVGRISLLPYHKGGCQKYDRLGKVVSGDGLSSPSEERLREIHDFFEASGFAVKRGG
jgi:pyruvate formate lyase activating enzyme